MHHTQNEDHGCGQPLAQSEVGHVSMCSCGVLTVTLHYLSLRFEPAAFRELTGMLNYAQQRIDSDPTLHSQQPSSIDTHSIDAPSIDAPPVH